MSGTRIRLPNYDSLPVGVYFHQEHPSERRVVLQVPNEDRSDSETYLVDLDDLVSKTWIEGLPNSRNLLTTLGWALHIAYAPRTGHFEEMPDLDMPSDASKNIARARQSASFQQTADRVNVMQRRRALPAPSKLRRALSARRGRGVRR